MNRRIFLKKTGFCLFGIGVVSPILANAFDDRCDEKICKRAWAKLCGNISVVYKNDAFEYVHPIEGFPNVLLYGDSVSIAYTPQVRALLKGKANVFRLFKNGGSSRNFIPNMEKMKTTMFQPFLKNGWNFNWDLIHFNVGLHDLKYLANGKLDKKRGKPVSSIDEYKSNLYSICDYLKKSFPSARLIFATTTPVPPNAKGRFSGDGERYNRAAIEVLANFPDISVNDLYAFTKPNQNEWAQEAGNVHFNELGYTCQGKEVARVIEQCLF